MILCNHSMHDFLELCGINNLPRFAMQPSPMLRSSLRAQFWVHLFTVLVHPWSSCWIINCIVASFFCSAHIIDICKGVMHGVNSCIVKSRSFSSILSYRLTLLVASANSTSFPGMYSISKIYGGIILSNNLCSLDGASDKLLSEYCSWGWWSDLHTNLSFKEW